MLHRGNFDDDWEDKAEDLLDESDELDIVDEGLEEPTVECPYCDEPIHEETQCCPYCGTYISEEDRTARRPPWWIALGVVVCLYLIYRWTVGR